MRWRQFGLRTITPWIELTVFDSSGKTPACGKPPRPQQQIRASTTAKPEREALVDQMSPAAGVRAF